MTHILACISAHGFGHFAMTAPILNALNKSDSISISVRCTLPEKLIRSRIDGEFTIISEDSDFGILMNSSLDVDLARTAIAYQKLHSNYSQAIEEEKTKLRQYNPDLILANIPYLTIAAASEAGIPVIAYCSLNWAEIFQSYFLGSLSGADKILDEMNAAYNAAHWFICPEPSMPMPSLTNVVNIGPIATMGENCRGLINRHFSLNSGDKLVLITPGGVATAVPVNDWPKIPGIIWLTAWPYKTERNDIISTEQMDILFVDLLQSCDAVISKPGYGTVTETVLNDVPALYVLRGDWAEEPFLINWWEAHGRVLVISRDDFFSGNLERQLRKLWELPNSSMLNTSGLQRIVLMIRSQF